MALQVRNFQDSGGWVPPFDLVVVAASMGGIEALKVLLAHLPEEFPLPLVVVQHLSPHYRSKLAELLDKVTALEVQWAYNSAPLVPGQVYLAPPAHHVVMAADKTLWLTQTEKVHFLRPAADVLFNSAATVSQNRTLGVVLTGMGRDGAAGAQAIKQAGGRIIIEEPNTSQAKGMPRATLAAGVVDFALPLERIASALVTFSLVPGGADLFYIPPAYTAHLLYR